MDLDRPQAGRWWLRALYAVLIVSAVSLGVLLLGDLVATLEGAEHADEEDGGLHHLFIFDLAWPVFLATAFFTLVAGLVTAILSRFRPGAGLGRFAAWAFAYVAIVAGLMLATGALEV